MAQQLKKLPAVFYRSPSGAEPVREWLRNLSAADRQVIGFDIATAEFGWPVGMPVCKLLGNGIWEIRSSLVHGRIARILFFVRGGHMVLLNGFIKKTRKTPLTELELAQKRRKETQRENA